MVDDIDLIEADVRGMALSAFVADMKTRDAVLSRLLRISEAARKLGDQAERLLPDQPWVHIRAFGNVLRHQYDEIDLNEVWRIVNADLPSLRRACQRALGSPGSV